MKLKVGLIGCGGIGAVHAECWLALSDKVQLTAIADVSLDRAREYAQKSDARVYDDGFKMLEKEELDVVDICVPTFLHAEYVIKAMSYVRNVIVEKPVCLKDEEVQKMLEAQEKTGALVQVAHVVRFMDAYAFLKKMVSSGEYGRVISGKFSRFSPRPKWMKGHDDLDRTGGMAMDLHIHDVDYIRYLMGEPDSISAWKVRDKAGIIQYIWGAYCFKDAVLVAEGSWDYPDELPFTQSFRVRMEKAAVVLDETGVLTVYPEEGEKWMPELDRKEEMNMGINVSDLSPYLKEIKYFIENIQTGNKEGITSLSEAAASLRLVLKELDFDRRSLC